MDISLISDQQKEEVERFAEGLNQRLAVAGGESAERAFGMGCALGILPTLLIILVLFLFQVINLVLAFILAAMGGLALVGISALMAFRARANTTRRKYEGEIDTEIEAYVQANQLSREQFDTLVSGLLSKDADLQAFLAPHVPEVSEIVDEESGGQVS